MHTQHSDEQCISIVLVLLYTPLSPTTRHRSSCRGKVVDGDSAETTRSTETEMYTCTGEASQFSGLTEQSMVPIRARNSCFVPVVNHQHLLGLETYNNNKREAFFYTGIIHPNPAIIN